MTYFIYFVTSVALINRSKGKFYITEGNFPLGASVFSGLFSLVFAEPAQLFLREARAFGKEICECGNWLPSGCQMFDLLCLVFSELCGIGIWRFIERILLLLWCISDTIFQFTGIIAHADCAQYLRLISHFVL